MNYATVVSSMFSSFPELEAIYRTEFAYMENGEPLPYIVFGSVLVPALAEALEGGNLKTILRVCAFLEDAALASRQDNELLSLMRIEVGEWLGWIGHEDQIAPWLGPETKRICNYVPGLATQRRQLKAEKQARTLKARAALIQRLRGS